MIDEYPLSPEQAEAVLVMHQDLGYSVRDIVSDFKFQGYPILKNQVFEIIRTKPDLDPLASLKSIYSQMIDMIMGTPEREFSTAY